MDKNLAVHNVPMKREHDSTVRVDSCIEQSRDPSQQRGCGKLGVNDN